MPHALRIYKKTKSIGFDDGQAMCIANVVEFARGEQAIFDRDKIVDELFDAGMTEEKAEAVAEVLRHCFITQRFATYFDSTKLKVLLVRGGIEAATAEQFLACVELSAVTPRTAEVRLPVKFVPSAGLVFMCDFTHLKKPEMQKERRAIVVSTRAAGGHGRCSVVPVSKHPANGKNIHHYKFTPGTYPFFHSSDPVWALCDHVYTVSLARLWAVNVGLKPQPNARISAADLEAIRKLVGTGIGL